MLAAGAALPWGSVSAAEMPVSAHAHVLAALKARRTEARSSIHPFSTIPPAIGMA
jgi:hypothetical protein